MEEIMDLQRTVKRESTYSGIGLHTGNITSVTFKPAPPNSGIKFVRSDLPGKPGVEANIKNVISVARGTTLGNGSFQIQTVEHIMATLCGLGIDNLIVEVNADEPPVADGSGLPFVETLEKAGWEEQNVEKDYFEITEPVEFSDGDVHLVVLPSDEFKVSTTIDYKHHILKSQYGSFTITKEIFEKEIAPARTYCFEHEIESLKRRGLARGGSLENAVVIGQNGIHNKDLRFPDEFVRHKILDLIGDVYLIGKPLKAHIIAIRCGHAANIALTRKLGKLSDKSAGSQASRIFKEEEFAGKVLGLEEIQSIIPHRPPFLFVDKIIMSEDMTKAVGFKNLTINEEYFRGHFPNYPIMPGVLIVESMAQTSCVLFLARSELRKKLPYFMAIREVKFRKPVFPGDQLQLAVEVTRARVRGGKIQGKAYVRNELVAEAEFMFSLVDR
jgi:UDP-3-O-[3-hydroxymyristoyl] N-acetylglucosamine deacetylase/3-hydroxyacyl-[acyl-carrier-protein] dehydratase